MCNESTAHKWRTISQQTKNITAVLPKEMFNDLQALKTRINGHDKDLDKTIQDFLEATDKKFLMTTVTLNNLHLATMMFTKTFRACTKVLRKYMGIFLHL